MSYFRSDRTGSCVSWKTFPPAEFRGKGGQISLVLQADIWPGATIGTLICLPMSIRFRKII
jgi:hypothetical protein